MALSSTVCVSLGWLPVEKLIEWGDSKKEFCELVNESSFQNYISESWNIIRAYCQSKGIQLEGLQEEEKQIIDRKIRQDIILSLAELNAIDSLKGESWSDIAKRTLGNTEWLRNQISKIAESIKTLIDNRIRVLRITSREAANLNLSDCGLIEYEKRNHEIGIYPIGELRQWAESKDEFIKAVGDNELKRNLRDKYKDLGNECANNSISIYCFEDFTTPEALEESIREHIIQELVKACCIASLTTGETWETVFSRTVLDKEWMDKQVNYKCEFLKRKVKQEALERRRAHMPDYDIMGSDGRLPDEPGGVNFLNLG